LTDGRGKGDISLDNGGDEIGGTGEKRKNVDFGYRGGPNCTRTRIGSKKTN